MPQAKRNDVKGWKPGALLATTSAPMHSDMLSDLSKAYKQKGEAVFLFHLSYSEPPAHFEELSRFVTELDECSGRKGVFQGLIIIDCTHWLGCEQSEYFDAFLAYLSDHQSSVRYVFSVSNRYPMQTMAMKAKMEEYFQVFYAEYENQAQKAIQHFAEERK